MPAVIQNKEESESSSEDEQDIHHTCIAWSGLSKKIPVLLFLPEAVISKDAGVCSIGERYGMAFKLVRTESRVVRGILTNHGFHEVHPNSNDFNLMWTGSHLKPYLLRSLQDFQKVNHFPRSYELTRKDRLFKNIQRMQQTHGFMNFHIVPQTFVLPAEYQEFCSCFSKDKGPWIIKPVASSRGRGIYLVSNPNQISMDENILVSRYIHNPLLIDEFKFDVRLYVLVTSYDPLLIYVYEEGLARFATVKYEQTSKHINNKFMHLTNYSVNKRSSDYVSCDDPEVEDYGNKWSMSAMLRYLKQEGKDTALLMRQVEDLIIKAVLSAEPQIAAACKMFVPHKNNCFELYGFDVLIDTDLKPWLLEVNLSPSLACDAPLDLKIKASMIADMFSLVGFVCQDPLSRQPRSDRFTLDPGLKPPAVRTQRPFSAPTAPTYSRRQRPTCGSNPESDWSKDRLGTRQGQGDSTLTLTAEEIKVLRRIKEEYERRGGFIRIFPTSETWGLYSGYLESKTSMNYMLATRLFHGRSVNGNVQLQVDAVHVCHVVQYERKLMSLEARKRRQRHLAHRSAPGKKKLGKESKASPTESSSQEVEECVQEETEEEKRVLQPVSRKALLVLQSEHLATRLESFHSKALPGSEAAKRGAKPRVNLLYILQQGWNLSKVQARMAFSSYLQRVKQRLLAESKNNGVPAGPDRDDDQMELVIRFLKRACSNLQQDIMVALPSHHLPLQDRRRLLAHQLGDFLHCYNKETEHMVKKQDDSKEEHCVNPGVFQEYIASASENDLEEVLTFYTQKNKSATVFLGTRGRRDERDVCAVSASAEPLKLKHDNPKSLSVAKEDSSTSESSLSTGRFSSDPDSKPIGSQPSVHAPGEEQTAVRTKKTQPEIRASQHCSSFPAALACSHVSLQRCSAAPAALPLHCPPPPPPAQPPSYAQSIAKSQTFSHPPAYTPAPMVHQPQRALWTAGSSGPNTASATQTAQVLRRIHSFTSPSFSSGATSSFPSATQIYSQKLSRPTSAGQLIKRSNSDKLRSNSMGAFKEFYSLSDQAQSNQQAITSVLQKLADKQGARQYASSSQINLLTQQLTNLNLANRVLSREGFSLNPKVRHHGAAVTQGPVRAVHSSGTDPSSTTGPRPVKDEERVWEGQRRSACRQHRPQPDQGGYQLQFAIQKLEQQKLQSQRCLEQSICRHQALFPDQTSALQAQAPPSESSSFHTRPSHSHGHSPARIGPALAPKPPSGMREGQGRKTATQRLIKPASTESPANGIVSSGQHIYQTICSKTGLYAYRKLFRGQEPNHR
ncbi:tubulin polyglutamylase TTLL5 [Genypterus blacodes]|uniref:tubulin polyglutamylase TTLL5 n=1 Tax=Genypterus blacodes TaxID=154954 RepID=UPI003F7663BB